MKPSSFSNVIATGALAFATLLLTGASADDKSSKAGHQPIRGNAFDRAIAAYNQELLDRGRQIFRFETFGDESFSGDSLKLHQAIAGSQNGGVGDGVSPETALAVGLKVDVEALPGSLRAQLRHGKVNLSDPATTIALLKLDAVVGVKGFFD